MSNNNEPVRTIEQFSFKNFIAKAILVVVFVLLLVWLMPMPDVKKLENNLEDVQSSVNVITDRIFNENLTLMKDAAKDYFTISRLPKNVNEKVKISLKDMIDKKLLLSVTDKKGNSCNTSNSYVEITRLTDQYEMKTYLSCDNMEDYILSYMDLECDKSCNDECTLVEKTPVVTKTSSSYTMYRFKKTVTNTTKTDWSNWTTEIKEADEKETKTEYKGRKWISKLVYKYEHAKTIPGETVCTEITVPGKTTCETVVVPGTCYQVWVPGVTKTCPRINQVVKYVTSTCSENVAYTDNECTTVKYKTGSKWVKQCSSCGYTLVDTYATKQVCNPVTKYRTITKSCTIPTYVNQTVYEDCSTPGYYETKTTPDTTKQVCTKLPDTKKTECKTGDTKSETIWTYNKEEAGYTATGNKQFVKDEGYYVYSNWSTKLESGYEKTETRTLYRYRYKKTTTDTKYTWSKYKSLGDGWVATGETKQVSI